MTFQTTDGIVHSASHVAKTFTRPNGQKFSAPVIVLTCGKPATGKTVSNVKSTCC